MCFALELKIFIMIISKEINVKRLSKNQKNIVFNLVLQLLAHIFYLSGTVLHQIELSFLPFLPGIVNMFGGVALLLSISTCY